MLAILLLDVLDHRLAFIFLSALVLGAAVPLAIAWTHILPEEAPPFEMGRAASAPGKISEGGGEVSRPDTTKRSRFAMVLLVAVSLSFLLQLPGFPRYVGLHSLLNGVPQNPRAWSEFVVACFFLAVPVAAVAHSLLKRNPLSTPLIWAGVLVLLLWLLSSPLRAALTAIS